MKQNYLYRYENSYDSDDNIVPSLEKFLIKKETNHFFFIEMPLTSDLKKVGKHNAKKAFAYRDVEKAKASFVSRKFRQIEYSIKHLAQACNAYRIFCEENKIYKKLPGWMEYNYKNMQYAWEMLENYRSLIPDRLKDEDE